MAGESHHRGHVQAVQVGALLAVNLDTDEIFIEEIGSGGGILKGFVRHDVAPVTGGIADAEEDGLVLPAGFLQSRLAPGIPIHRVIRMLAQVGRERVGEMVGHRVLPQINREKISANPAEKLVEMGMHLYGVEYG